MLQVISESKLVQLTILDKAIEILRRGWTKSAMARDEHNCDVPVESRYARTFCFFGALHRANFELEYPSTNPDYSELIKFVHGLDNDMVAFNDSSATRVEDVIVKAQEFKSALIQQ